MRMARRTGALILAGAMLLAGCGKEAPAPATTAATEAAASMFTDGEAARMLEDYLQACTDAAAERSAVYLLSDNRSFTPLLSCKVWSQTRLNENLWVFSVQQQTADRLFSGSVFVGAVNGALYVFPAVTDIPEELRTGFQWEYYIVPDEEVTEPTETEEESTAETEAVTEETTLPADSSGTVSGGTSTAPTTTPGYGEPGFEPPGNHDLKVTTNFDCINGGTKHYKCKYCDWEFTVAVAPKGSHRMPPENRIVTVYDCRSGGNYIWGCTECSYVDAGSVPPQACSLVVYQVYPATESAGGHTEYVCTVCKRHEIGDLTPPLGTPTQPTIPEVPPATQETQPAPTEGVPENG